MKLFVRVGLVAAMTAAATLPAVASADEIPNPIDPSSGEANLLEIIDGLPLNEIESALDHFPIPYVVVASAGGAAPTIKNDNAGSPTRIDADDSAATGRGGNDVIVEVNTELFPTPHLNLSIDRIGTPPFAEDLSVIVAFPFSAFSDEALPGDPNLFFGYSTTAQLDGDGYPAGGHAPTSVDIDLTPDLLGGTSHIFELGISTVGDDNPVRFIGGHFDGDPASTPINALAFSAHADPVPDTISLGVDVNFSQILLGGASESLVGVTWAATEPTKVTFDYLENETFPFTTPDYNTTLTFDQMPATEEITIGADIGAGTITLGHRGSSPIGELTLLHQREDGLSITGVASDIPTEVDVTLDTAGAAAIDVNANTMDLEVVATQEGGFLNTSGFFGFDVGYVSLVVEDVPDLSAEWDSAQDRFAVHATNPGESIGLVELMMDDDAEVAEDGTVVGLDLPPSWSDAPTHHIFSLVDDGTHGTAAARAVALSDVVLDLNTAPVAHHFEFGSTEASPMQAYLSTTAASSLTNEDVDVTCDIDDIPAGLVTIDLGFPPPTIDIDYSAVPPATIDTISCTGSVGTLNFLVGISDLPPEFGVAFDPDASLAITAGNGVDSAPSAVVGQVLLRLWDDEGPTGLPDSDGLFGEPLRDAVAQADDVPSLLATWADDATGTDIEFDTVAAAGPFAFLGGVQIQVSNEVELSTPLVTPSPAADHYATLIDEGADARKRIEAGVFGIDHVGFQTTDGAGDRTIAMQYAADEDHGLIVDVDTALGGAFFPDYAIDATLTVDDVPQTWDFSTNLATELEYTASDGIESVELVADIEIETAPMVVELTHVEAGLFGLPSQVEYFLEPEVEGSAFVHMNAPIDLATVELTSDDAVLESDFRHIKFSAEDIPANWDSEWGVAPNPHASLVTSSPLGPVELIISRDIAANTSSKYDAFAAAGGAVEYSDFAREIDRRYFRQGAGDDATRETVFMSRLDSIYDTTLQLDPDEDHVIISENGSGDMDFLSVRGTGFQSIEAEAGSTITATLNIPFIGDHPFFVGLRDSAGEATLVQVENIPDTTDIEIAADHANVDFNTEPGDILVYQGPFGTAGDGTDALKVLVVDSPAFVHASWDLGFPGGVALDTANPIEVRLLNQQGNSRQVVDVVVGDLSATWGFNTGTTTEKCQLDPPGCGEYLKIAEVFFDFEASPELEGFFSSYERIGSPSGLSPAGPTPGANEYVPRISVLLDDFTHFDVSIEAEICLVGVCPIGVPTVGTTIDTDLLGSVNFDWWDLGGGFLDFFGDPDYVTIDPWDFWPVFHSQDDHLFPFN
jgi:hypothetical protein